MTKRSYKIDTIAAIIAAMVLVIYTHAMTIKCPTLTCSGESETEDHLQDNICFQHDGGNPTLKQ